MDAVEVVGADRRVERDPVARRARRGVGRGCGRAASGSWPGTASALDRAWSRLRRRLRGLLRRVPTPGPHRAVVASGRRGRQTVAPRSMSACVHVAGRPSATTPSARACTSRAGMRFRATATTRPRTRRTLTSTAPTRSAERDGRDRASRVGTDARQRLERLDRVGDAPAVLVADDRRRPPQGECAPVVAETLPLAKDVGGRSGRERLDGREARHEALPMRCGARGLGLLGHRLGDEDRVRVGGPAERERPAMPRVPARIAPTRRRREPTEPPRLAG